MEIWIKIRIQFQEYVRSWLGLNYIKSRVSETPHLISNVYEEQQQIKAHLLELLATCQRLEQKMSLNHLDKPIERVSSQTYDWDAVQVMALQDMQKNPPKEN